MNVINKLRKNRILSSGINYSMASTLTSVVSMLVSILNMRLIGPQEMGIWQSVCIVAPYFTFFQLGIQSGLNLELPILMGNKNENKIREYIATALYCSRIVTLLIFMIGVVAAIIFSNYKYDSKFIFSVLVMILLAVNESITIHLVARYRSAGSFNALAKIHWIQSFFMFSMIVLIWLFGFNGFLVYTLIYPTVKTILMITYSPFRDITPHFYAHSFKSLFKVGIIMMGFGQVRSLAQSIPRWFLLVIGGTVSVGLFSPALAIGTIMNLLPNQIVQFFQPQMGYKYGESKNASHLWIYAKKSIIYVPLSAILVALPLYILEPWIISTFFPKYVESISAIQIITIGFIFSTSFISHSVLYTIKAYKEAILYSIIEVIGYLIFPLLAYYILKCTILNSVAIGISTTYFILHIANYFIVRKALLKPKYNIN